VAGAALAEEFEDAAGAGEAKAFDAYRVVVAGTSTAPSFLSCADGIARAETHYQAVAFTRR
jgi:hypothetical protein